MKRLFSSLLFRVAALSLLGLVAIQAAILAAAVWPDGRPISFRLVAPSDARQIAEAVERSPVELRSTIVAAASNGATVVQLLPSASSGPGVDPALQPAPHLEDRFRRYEAELDGRPIEIQARAGLLAFGPGGDRPPAGPIRLLIRLRTGELLAIERAPLVLQLLAERYLIIALVAALVLAALTAMLFWQVVKPLRRLARATEALRDDMNAPDAPVAGAPELRQLALAFNGMKHRISGLVAERTRILAAIAHDLRTYLTRLRLRIDHIEDDRQRRRAADDIEDMRRLIEDTLLFARLDAVADRTAPLIDACTEAANYVELRRETGDPVELDSVPAAILCRCAPLAFRRILANLIDNALRYGTWARISVSAETGLAVITVADNGPGIPPDLAQRLTGPFERLDASRGRHSGGAGLGLAIVKGLAESHGGNLSLFNGSNGGLNAIVRLPTS